MILIRCRIIVSKCLKSQGRERNLPMRQKKIQQNSRACNMERIVVLLFHTFSSLYLLEILFFDFCLPITTNFKTNSPMHLPPGWHFLICAQIFHKSTASRMHVLVLYSSYWCAYLCIPLLLKTDFAAHLC